MSIHSFSGEHEFLSNFYPSQVVFRGRDFPTVEHAYQSAKTDVETEITAIQVATFPGRAKRLGQQVQKRASWEQEKVDVMRQLLRQKFCQGELREKLLQTGRRHLMEGNHWGDRFWGVCEGEGENHLGRLLMDVRREILEERL